MEDSIGFSFHSGNKSLHLRSTHWCTRSSESFFAAKCARQAPDGWHVHCFPQRGWWVSEWVEFNAPPDTIQVISEAENNVSITAASAAHRLTFSLSSVYFVWPLPLLASVCFSKSPFRYKTRKICVISRLNLKNFLVRLALVASTTACRVQTVGPRLPLSA